MYYFLNIHKKLCLYTFIICMYIRTHPLPTGHVVYASPFLKCLTWVESVMSMGRLVGRTFCPALKKKLTIGLELTTGAQVVFNMVVRWPSCHLCPTWDELISRALPASHRKPTRWCRRNTVIVGKKYTVNVSWRQCQWYRRSSTYQFNIWQRSSDTRHLRTLNQLSTSLRQGVNTWRGNVTSQEEFDLRWSDLAIIKGHRQQSHLTGYTRTRIYPHRVWHVSFITDWFILPVQVKFLGHAYTFCLITWRGNCPHHSKGRSFFWA